MPRSRLLEYLTAIVLLVCSVVGCKQAEPTVLKSTDGKFQITVPGGWKEDPTLGKLGDIKAANPQQEMYVIVITEEKSGFTDETTLDDYTNSVLEAMKSKLTSAYPSRPVPVTVNGNAGRQSLIPATLRNMQVSYLVTTVETAAHFSHVMSWTRASRMNVNQMNLQEVSMTFRPTDQGGTDASVPAK